MQTNLNNQITTTENNVHARRTELKALSQPLRLLLKEGAIGSINDGLKSIYKQSGHAILNTLRQWNKQGKRVKKGEKALLLWAAPKHVEKVNPETAEVDEFDFWPICYVFSNAQVIEREG